MTASCEDAHPLLLGLLYGGDLLCNHREHFHIDTIKLIEASPGTGAANDKIRNKGEGLCYPAPVVLTASHLAKPLKNFPMAMKSS